MSPPDMQGRVVSNRGIRFTGRMSVIVDFALYAFDADLAQQVEPLFRAVLLAVNHPLDTGLDDELRTCLLYTSPSPRDRG